MKGHAVMARKTKTLILLLMLAVLLLAACTLQGPNLPPSGSDQALASPQVKGSASPEPEQSTPAARQQSSPLPGPTEAALPRLDEAGSYTSKEDVANFLRAYGRLPDNFISKAEARALGWPGGDLRPYAPLKTIGGDRFGNREGLLPSKKGRQYYECDIDTLGKSSRGAKRLVYSNDGLIFYTDDHYQSFTQLEGGTGT